MRGDHMEVIALLQKYGGKVRPPGRALLQPLRTARIGLQHLAASVQCFLNDAAAMLLSLECCR